MVGDQLLKIENYFGNLANLGLVRVAPRRPAERYVEDHITVYEILFRCTFAVI
jgi:hypothetical protein